MRKSALTNYWLEHYVSRGHCGLCGNSGVIRTIGVKTAAGFEVGGEFWCICPNGQALRKQCGGESPAASRAASPEEKPSDPLS